jgi:glycosyltransferase involved in cell wall biosynthesis
MVNVSIITPLYNKADYVISTIQSVVSQNYSDWEMLVVDNGSSDGSVEKVQQFQEDSRIQLLYSPKRGPGAARNYGLARSQGKWIQFLDADDLLAPKHLEQQLAIAQKHPNVDIIACYWQEFTDDNPSQLRLKKPTGIGQPLQVLRDTSIAFAPWAIHAAIIKRSALSQDCYWPEELDQYLGEDIAFWFRLVNNCTLAYGQSKGVYYRTQTAQCRTQIANPKKWLEGVNAALEYNLQYLANSNQSYTPTQAETLMRVYSSIYLLARTKNAIETQYKALTKASHWLDNYFRVADKAKASLLVRRFLGLKLFLKLFGRKGELTLNESN